MKTIKLNPIKDLPEAPDTLGTKGKALWLKYGEALIRSGLLCDEYLNGLSDLCWWEEKVWELKKLTNVDNIIHVKKDSKGNVSYSQRSAYFLALNTAQEKVMNLRDAYGFTPFSKQKLQKPEVKEENIKVKNF